MMALCEEWRSVVGAADFYSVSNPGRVRREVRRGTYQAGSLLRPSRTVTGYREVRLCIGGRRQNRTVHALVTEAFLGPRPPGMQVNHKNAVKSDNRLGNLEYVTDRQNKEHAARLGLLPFGERHHAARLSEEGVRLIWATSKRPYYGWRGAVARALGVSDTTVRDVLAGRGWRRVSEQLGCV